MNNNIAILILAHDNYDCIFDWTNNLQDQNIHFFLHVDKKSCFGFEERNLFSKIRNFTVLKDSERVEVNWGGRTQVDAMLALLNSAYNSTLHLSNFLFVSGHDFPIVSARELLNRFLFNKSMVRIDRVIGADNSRRITHANIYDWKLLNPKNNKGLARIICSCICSFLSLVPKQKLKDDFTFVHGSQWFSLNRNDVESILDFLNKNHWYYDYFRYSFGSDEVFFHSIIFNLNLEIEQNYINYNESQKKRNMQYGVHYIDWLETNNNEGGPRLLVCDDIDAIKTYRDKGACFVRKIDYRNSEFMLMLKKINRDDV